MKRKVDITFEVKTTIEVYVPDNYKRLNDYIVDHKSDIAKQAREQVLDGGINTQLSWNNLVWNEEGAVDFSDLDFNF